MNSIQINDDSSITNQGSSINTYKKVKIAINIYDLLPPGKLSSILWACGSALLHSGVVINDREYAYGGHHSQGVTGIYYTPPRSIPPGGTFRCEILHGFTIRSPSEIDSIIKEASELFQGTSYNILSKNCNHFTSFLLEKLTNRPGPAWLNRAASIGLALPCVVPKEWISPPDFETANGDLVDEEEDEERVGHERTRMLESTDSSSRISVEKTVNQTKDEQLGLGRKRTDSFSILDRSRRTLPLASKARVN
ncbi:DeSI-like protein sdu1 [Erysiphe neolycopersici]|uniref:DeSI-like protein sdu1 n=1 Tax=Erysiphe neolycopersici TaxID=212602 RepID=A0A420HG98_9PEZI|nr:DeSI-like protein sdu1 [Erysiphe neolycopersici]